MQKDVLLRQGTDAEVILKEHRRWTRWIQGPRNLGEGNLVLTNRRVLFLHRIPSSHNVTAKIKKLTDAPIEAVLNYAFTLGEKNFQIPLSSITRVGIGNYVRFPFPHFYLTLSYLEGKKKIPRTVGFRFRRPIIKVILRPQVIEDWKWVKVIRKAMSEKGRLNTT